MILVLTGTGPYQFERVVRKMDELAANKGLEVTVQLGATERVAPNCHCVDYLAKDEILALIAKASAVVTHGGYGSICDVLAQGKTPVVVPRMQEFGEIHDNQLELVRALDDEGWIVAVYDVSELESAIEKAENMPSERVSENRIPGIIDDFLKQNLG